MPLFVVIEHPPNPGLLAGSAPGGAPSHISLPPVVHGAFSGMMIFSWVIRMGRVLWWHAHIPPRHMHPG